MDLILGGGITGLLASYMLDVPVVTDIIGGTAMHKWPLGPRFVYAKDDTEEVLRTLGLERHRYNKHIGYYMYGEFVEPTEELRRLYSEKTRGVAVDGAMSNKDSTIRVIDIEFDQLTRALSGAVAAKSNLIIDKITKVDTDEKLLIGTQGSYDYDMLLNTIPLPELLSLAGLEHLAQGIEYKPIYFSHAALKYEKIMQSKYSYICFPDPEVAYYRLTKLTGDTCVYEFGYSPGFLVSYFQGTRIRETTSLKYGKIVSGSLPSQLLDVGIYSLGRWAEWKPRLMLHDVISTVKEWR